MEFDNKQELIRLENVSMQYRFPTEKVDSLKEFLVRFVKGKMKYRKFNALQNINLTVMRGESLGIIGHNGAGKSTLLQIIAELMAPTSGKIYVNGVSSLLSLGTGFDGEETGKDNIFLSGAFMGFSKKDMQARFDSIAEFSELGEFLNVKLKNYSSGMRMRLAFAIAIDVNPDILITDEVLSTGDAAFSKKCEDKINSLRQNGTTIILVSHSMAQIRKICKKVVWIDHGTIRMMGAPDEVCSAYEADCRARYEKGINPYSNLNLSE